MRENRLKQFRNAMRSINDDVVKSISEIRVEKNQQGRYGPNKKWIEVIKEEMRTCRVDKYIIWSRQWQKGKLQIAHSTTME